MTARPRKQVAEALKVEGGRDAVTLRVAEQYVSAFEKLAKETNTVLLPSTPGDPAAMVGAAMGIFEGMRGGAAGGSGGVRGVKGGLPPSKLADLKREVPPTTAPGSSEHQQASCRGSRQSSLCTGARTHRFSIPPWSGWAPLASTGQLTLRARG